MSTTLKTLSIAFVAMVMLALSAPPAAAWSCQARSRIGEGWGYSPVLKTAREEARLQCMLHTPRYMRCRVIRCVR